MPESEDRVFVQLYALAPIDLDTFQIVVDPYGESEGGSVEEKDDEIARLAAMGIVFLRDEDHASAAVFVPPPFPAELFYSQFAYEIETGEVLVATRVEKNRKCRVQWMTRDRVHRVWTD